MAMESNPADNRKQIIIMVHGTFAAADSDLGEQWWQHGSVFWRELAQYLPGNFDQTASIETFHWQGSNSATDRRSGTDELLKLITKYEKARQPYHLIGHSHGGSVIWDALQLAYLKNKKLSLLGSTTKPRSKIEPLRHMRSWVTVGTPFVFQKPSAFKVAASFFSGFLLIGVMLAVAVEIYSLEQFDILTSTIKFAPYLIPFYILLSMTISGMEASQLDKERRVCWHAMHAFGDRWLGLWHSEDEAINGLRASLNLSGHIVPRRRKYTSGFTFQKLSSLFAPIAFFFNPLFNWVLAPLGDHFVWQRVKNKTVGNDRPGAKVKAVSAAPMEFMHAIPPLPENVSTELTQSADEAATQSLSKLRLLISRLGGGVGEGVIEEIQASGFSGKELIHTSYFENSAIQKILANHMIRKAGDGEPLELEPETEQWLANYQSLLKDYLDTEPVKSYSLVAKVMFLLLALYAAIGLVWINFEPIKQFINALLA